MTDSRLLPRSAVNPVTGLAGLVGLAASLLVFSVFDFAVTDTCQAILLCFAMALPMIAMECLALRVHGSVATLQPVRTASLSRSCVKLAGLYASFACIALAYWAFPEYAGEFYAPYFDVLNGAWPAIVALAVPYIVWLDRCTPESNDGAWHAGMAVLGRWAMVDRVLLGQYARGWVVKAFFLPLMFVLFVHTSAYIIDGLATGAMRHYPPHFGFFLELAFVVDLGFACVGYALASRALGTHIRSTEPTMLGWAVTLACYQPFWGLISGSYLAYESDGINWTNLLPAGELSAWVWSTLVLILAFFYAWASVAFGLRFSNLTHRGIITNGPYRLTKHPAYLAKNVLFWLIAAPFVAAGAWPESLRACLLLVLVNILYYLRARTEERHLAQDPVYIRYALWVEDNGVLRHLGKYLPRLFAFRWRRTQAESRAHG